MCGRVFSTLRRVDIGRISRTNNINDTNQSYSRNYNIGPRSYLPCIVNSSCTSKINFQRISEQEEQMEQKIILPKAFKKSNQPESGKKDENTSESKKNEMTKLGIQDQSTAEEEEKSWSQVDLNPFRKVEVFKWEWAFEDFAMINARGEEIGDKPFFRKYSQNRCVVIVEGTYEWDKKKLPYAYRSQDKDHMLIAGLYDDLGQVVLVTMAASDELLDVHSRMPYVMTEDEIDIWIDPKISLSEAVRATIEKSLPKWSLKSHRVPVLVNKVRNKGRVNQMTLDEYKDHMGTAGGGIMSFFAKGPKTATGPTSKVQQTKLKGFSSKIDTAIIAEKGKEKDMKAMPKGEEVNVDSLFSLKSDEKMPQLIKPPSKTPSFKTGKAGGERADAENGKSPMMKILDSVKKRKAFKKGKSEKKSQNVVDRLSKLYAKKRIKKT